MKTEIVIRYSDPGGQLRLNEWRHWRTRKGDSFARDGYYVAVSGHHVRVNQHDYDAGKKQSTTLELYIGNRHYSLRREKLYNPHGLSMLAARFVKDVLELKK